jgi:predicted MPP superfamily phosphohydrolase
VSAIAIGDVHGNRAALDDLLARLERELEVGDTVVFLGDYIDRGPDSKGCIDRILRFRAESPATVVALLGNHEDGLLQTLEDPHRYSWLTVMEGFATVRNYSAAAADVLGRAVEAAGPRLVLDRVALPYGEAMIWGTATFLTHYGGPDIVLYGHWDNSDLDADGWPMPAIGRASIGIDTISHGVLTAFRLPDRRVFQSDRFT